MLQKTLGANRAEPGRIAPNQADFGLAWVTLARPTDNNDCDYHCNYKRSFFIIFTATTTLIQPLFSTNSFLQISQQIHYIS